MMKFFRIALAALLLAQPFEAAAMQQSQIPTKTPTPWGNSAGTSYIRVIPQTSQIGIQNCAASYPDGFPPLTFLPVGAGGCPPYGQDFNGILNAITMWTRWMQATAGLPWDSAFSASIGGYPKGAIVQSNLILGRLWFSTIDNNTTNPDNTGGGIWTVLPGTYAPGAPIASFSTAPTFGPPNAVLANGLTVGNAASNATNRANADTFWLFNFLWINCTTCQMFNPSGGAIARGANSGADFAANNAIQTINANGAGLIGADSMTGTTTTFLANVPVTSGFSTVPGSLLGENLHTLTVTELASHTHGNSLNDPGHVHANTLTDPGHHHTYQVNSAIHQDGTAINDAMISPIPANTGTSITGMTINNAGQVTGMTITNAAQGGGGAHNNVERSLVVYWWLSL